MHLNAEEEEMIIERRDQEINELWQDQLADQELDRETHVACHPETDDYEVMPLDEAARLMADGQIINETYEENFEYE